MRKTMSAVLGMLMVLGMVHLSPSAYATPYGDGEKGSGKGKQDPFFKGLNLTPEQKEKVKARYTAQQDLRKQRREQMKAKMEVLHAELGKPGTDRAVVSGLVADINAMKAQSFAARIEGVMVLKEILTPEQFAKFQAKHKERGFWKYGNWKKHQGKGPRGEGEGQVPDGN